MKISVHSLPKVNIPEHEDSMWFITTDAHNESADFKKALGFENPIVAETKILPQIHMGYRIENNS